MAARRAASFCDDRDDDADDDSDYEDEERLHHQAGKCGPGGRGCNGPDSDDDEIDASAYLG